MKDDIKQLEILQNQMQELLQKDDGSEKRELSTEDDIKFDELKNQAEALQIKIKNAEKEEERKKTVDDIISFVKGTDDKLPQQELNTGVFSDAEKREQEAQLLNLAFRGDKEAIAELRNIENRVLGTGKNMQDGGVTIPTTLNNEIIGKLNDASALRQTCTVQSVGVNHNVAMEISETGGQTTAEGVAIPQSAGDVFSSSKIDITKHTISYGITQEMFDDSQFNIMSFISSRGASRIGILEEKTLMPRLLAQIGLGLTATSTNAITSDELINLSESIIPAYQNNAKWTISQRLRAFIRLLKDTTNRPLYDASLIQNERSVLLGRPLHLSSELGELAQGKTVGYYGDTSYITLGVVGNMRIQVDPYSLADKQVVRIIMSMRSGILLTNTDAVKKIVMKA